MPSESNRSTIYVRESQALPALVNVFIPPFGQLIQGRVYAFFVWLIALVVAALSMFVLVGFVLFPILYIWCIVDAAKYRSP